MPDTEIPTTYVLFIDSNKADRIYFYFAEGLKYHSFSYKRDGRATRYLCRR